MSAWQGGARARRARRATSCVATASRRVETAIKTLETLTGPLLGSKDAPYGQTSERLALIASAYKRLAMMQSGKKRLQALDRMKTLLPRSGSARGDAAGRCRVSAAERRRGRSRGELAEPDGADRRGAPGAQRRSRRTTWRGRARLVGTAARTGARVPALRDVGRRHLLEVLASGTLDDAAIDSIVADYLDYRAAGSVRQVDSVFAQFDFLHTMARTVQLRDRLDSLRQRLRQGAAGDPDRALPADDTHDSRPRPREAPWRHSRS